MDTKRLFDIAAAGGALVMLSPLILAIALLIRFQMGKPVLFKQLRPGLGGKPFKLVKFRTMTTPKPGEDGVDTDRARLTPLGQRLRGSSLDELPELWNVLRGDMSLVGPRPLLMQYLPRYTSEQARRHQVRPGLTGWAQVNGRNALSWEEKFRLDVWYVDKRSWWLDLKIIWMTVMQVIRARGVNAPGSATMPEFMGSETAALTSSGGGADPALHSNTQRQLS